MLCSLSFSSRQRRDRDKKSCADSWTKRNNLLANREMTQVFEILKSAEGLDPGSLQLQSLLKRAARSRCAGGGDSEGLQACRGSPGTSKKRSFEKTMLRRRPRPKKGCGNILAKKDYSS